MPDEAVVTHDVGWTEEAREAAAAIRLIKQSKAEAKTVGTILNLATPNAKLKPSEADLKKADRLVRIAAGRLHRLGSIQYRLRHTSSDSLADTGWTAEAREAAQVVGSLKNHR